MERTIHCERNENISLVSKLFSWLRVQVRIWGILAADKRRSGTVLPQLRFHLRIHLGLNKHSSKLHGKWRRRRVYAMVTNPVSVSALPLSSFIPFQHSRAGWLTDSHLPHLLSGRWGDNQLDLDQYISEVHGKTWYESQEVTVNIFLCVSSLF